MYINQKLSYIHRFYDELSLKLNISFDHMIQFIMLKEIN